MTLQCPSFSLLNVASVLTPLLVHLPQIPKAACLSLFPHLVALLLDEHNVVHSYAAHAIERLLVVKDAGRPRFTPQVRAGGVPLAVRDTLALRKLHSDLQIPGVFNRLGPGIRVQQASIEWDCSLPPSL